VDARERAGGARGAGEAAGVDDDQAFQRAEEDAHVLVCGRRGQRVHERRHVGEHRVHNVGHRRQERARAGDGKDRQALAGRVTAHHPAGAPLDRYGHPLDRQTEEERADGEPADARAAEAVIFGRPAVAALTRHRRRVGDLSLRRSIDELVKE